MGYNSAPHCCCELPFLALTCSVPACNLPLIPEQFCLEAHCYPDQAFPSFSRLLKLKAFSRVLWHLINHTSYGVFAVHRWQQSHFSACWGLFLELLHNISLTRPRGNSEAPPHSFSFPLLTLLGLLVLQGHIKPNLTCVVDFTENPTWKSNLLLKTS